MQVDRYARQCTSVHDGRRKGHGQVSTPTSGVTVAARYVRWGRLARDT